MSRKQLYDLLIEKKDIFSKKSIECEKLLALPNINSIIKDICKQIPESKIQEHIETTKKDIKLVSILDKLPKNIKDKIIDSLSVYDGIRLSEVLGSDKKERLEKFPDFIPDDIRNIIGGQLGTSLRLDLNPYINNFRTKIREIAHYSGFDIDDPLEEDGGIFNCFIKQINVGFLKKYGSDGWKEKETIIWEDSDMVYEMIESANRVIEYTQAEGYFDDLTVLEEGEDPEDYDEDEIWNPKEWDYPNLQRFQIQDCEYGYNEELIKDFYIETFDRDGVEYLVFLQATDNNTVVVVYTKD